MEADADDLSLISRMLEMQKASLAITDHDVVFLQKCQRSVAYMFANCYLRIMFQLREYFELHLLMTGYQCWQRNRARQLLQEASGHSALVWYRNDTSPLTTRDVQRNTLG